MMKLCVPGGGMVRKTKQPLRPFKKCALGAVPSPITKLMANKPIADVQNPGIITDCFPTTSNPGFLGLGPIGVWGWINFAVGPVLFAQTGSTSHS